MVLHAYAIEEVGAEAYYQWPDSGLDEVNPLWVRAMRDEIARGRRLVFACTRDGRYLGRCELVLAHRDPDYVVPGQRAHLSLLHVEPAARRRGVGRALLQHLAAFCRQAGYEEISVGVNLDNREARDLYRTMGFTTVAGSAEDEDGAYVKLVKALGDEPQTSLRSARPREG